MGALTGTNAVPIGGVAGFTEADPFATPEQRNGGTADPRHGTIGEVATPYQWEVFPGESHGPYGIENGLLGVDIASYSMEAGYLAQDPTADLTPITHAAPWPKGVPQSILPDDPTDRRTQSAEIHAIGMGGSREALYEPTLNPVQDNWQLIDETDPGMTFPAMQEIPSQLKGSSAGWGSRDRIQSNARQNEYGFDSAHMRRRYAAGSIPGNFMWLQPGGRPLVKTIPGTAQVPVGADSPFAGQDPGQSWDAQGGALFVLPVTYQGPPDPSVASSYPVGEAPSVDLW